MHRRALTAAISGAAVALTGALAGVGTVGPAQADATASPLVLDAPKRVVARSFGNRVYSDLGVRLTAQHEDFEIRANRPTYDDPIQAVWKRESGDVPLPASAMTSWQGLDDFAVIRVRGKKIRQRSLQVAGCFNGGARKVGPAGPASNPYPRGCPWNPYTVGSVMGVAQDYTSSLLSQFGGRGLRLKPGTYDMVAVIRPAWRSRLGISKADGRVTSTLVVKKGRNNFRPTQRTADQGADTTELQPTTAAPTAESAGAMANEFAPDLRSLPAFDIGLNGKGTVMRFGATVWNGGNGPMVVEGFPEAHSHARRAPGEHERHMTAYQYYFDGAGDQTGYDEVGEFAYHSANHNHWHFEDFARYRLFSPDPEDPSQPGAAVVKSTKASFCLVATDAVDYTVPNADWRPEYTDLSSQCGGRNAKSLRQVLSNGSGDTYHQFRAGQAFRIGNLPDGTYFISVEANPADRPKQENEGRNLQELDYTNNDSYRKIIITHGAGGKRRVRVPQVGIIKESGFDEFLRR